MYAGVLNTNKLYAPKEIRYIFDKITNCSTKDNNVLIIVNGHFPIHSSNLI